MVRVRPMGEEDVQAAYRVASKASSEDRAEVLERSPEEVEARLARYRRFLKSDPEGCFVAEDVGRVVGVAVALRREGLWVLSTFAVEKGFRGLGVGAALLRRALDYGEGCASGMIASSTHPQAMHSYALAGFDLHPTLTAKGKVCRERIPAGLKVCEGDVQDLELAADVDRILRGAAHGPDLEQMFEEGRMLVSEGSDGRGYAVVREGTPGLLGATGEKVASDLLWACLADAGPEKEVFVPWITARQNWAVRVALAAGLELEPSGPICVRGNPGPLAPYLPSAPYL